MIRSWNHKGLKRFFATGSTAGINADHAARLAKQLRHLDDARQPQDMNIPGWDLHPLKGDMEGHWSVKASKNWRLTFRFDGMDAFNIDYHDYH